MCNIAGSRLGVNLDFISTHTYFAQDTVRIRCGTALATTQQDVLKYVMKDLGRGFGSQEAMTVCHVGAKSGAQQGKLSHIMAYRFTGPNIEDVTDEYCILGQTNAYKEAGDDAGEGGIVPTWVPLPVEATASTWYRRLSVRENERGGRNVPIRRCDPGYC
jgi:hypothetical protein